MAGKIIVIAGPTASGKTGLSIELAKMYNGEIVSADSMQVYRRMDIGTAKATLQERSLVPHHMLDVAEPDENYSVARYVEEASLCCDDIIARGKIPILTGGTGLYIDSLLSGRDFAESRADSAVRDALEKEYDALGPEAMHARLASVDPERAAKLGVGDRRRVLRALEVWMLTGQTITEHDRLSRLVPERYDAAFIVLNFARRAMLYERIDRRVDMMLEEGLEGEVRSLLASGLSPDCTAMQAIGYKEMAEYVAGRLSLTQAVELIKQSSRRYAKRQLTWFRRREGALWLNRENGQDMQSDRQLSSEFLRSRGIS